MKKILSLLCGSLIVLLMFAAPGNPVQAAENLIYVGVPPEIDHSDDNCACHELTPLSGSERNKMVSNLLKTDIFKDAKKDLKNQGYKWNGANEMGVIILEEGVTLVVAPFTTDKGVVEIHGFIFFTGL
jgi:hypothetical protein